MTLARNDQPNGSVETYRPDQAPVAPQWGTGVTDLVAWAHQYDAAYRFASGICNTAFVSQQYRNKPEEAAAAILAGSELGFSPMTCLRGLFDNIQGVTAPRAITQRAVVQSRGHELWTVHEECNEHQAVVRGRRKGSDVIQQSTWTMERARGLNLTGKDNWKKQPGAMLIARATSECARLVASDALLGVPYSVEEIRDDPSLHEVHPDERAALPSPRQAARGATRTSAADLTGESPVEAPANVTAAVEMIDRGQMQRLGKAFNDAGVDKAARLAIVNRLTDRTVGAANELTAPEADDLLTSLADLGADGIAALAPAKPAADVEPDEGADEGLFDGDDQ